MCPGWGFQTLGQNLYFPVPEFMRVPTSKTVSLRTYFLSSFTFYKLVGVYKGSILFKLLVNLQLIKKTQMYYKI